MLRVSRLNDSEIEIQSISKVRLERVQEVVLKKEGKGEKNWTTARFTQQSIK